MDTNLIGRSLLQLSNLYFSLAREVV
jgi:hypothetical protein